MLVNSPVCLLSLQFTDILLLIITAVTPRQVNCVFRPASGFLANPEPFAARSIGKHIRVHNVITTSGICPSPAWGAPAGLVRDGPNDLSSRELCLSKDITQILVPPETYSGFVREFRALGLVDL